MTLDTNRPAVSLHSLFPSLLPPAIEDAPPNAMGFKLLAGPELTIVASKSAGVYVYKFNIYELWWGVSVTLS